VTAEFDLLDRSWQAANYLIVVCVIGDGEAETGPLEGSWKAPSFLNPGRDGAVLPILHLNGYKISGPTVLGRRRDEDVLALLAAHGWAPILVEGHDPSSLHPTMAAALDAAHGEIRRIQSKARSGGEVTGPSRWPAIVLRTPKGLDRPRSRRWRTGGGDLPLPSGAVGQRSGQPDPPCAARGVDALIPTRAPVRRCRCSGARAGRARSRR